MTKNEKNYHSAEQEANEKELEREPRHKNIAHEECVAQSRPFCCKSSETKIHDLGQSMQPL